MVSKLLILFFLTTVTWPTVFSIKCYQCNSNENSDCTSLPVYENEMDRMIQPTECVVKENTTTQNVTEPFCRKIVYSVSDNNADWHDRVVRSCGYIKSKLPCHSYNNNDHEELVCQCFEDACNSAHPTTSTCALTIASLLAAIFLK